MASLGSGQHQHQQVGVGWQPVGVGDDGDAAAVGVGDVAAGRGLGQVVPLVAGRMNWETSSGGSSCCPEVSSLPFGSGRRSRWWAQGRGGSNREKEGTGWETVVGWRGGEH
jgi:hypothetical protein